jgi:hypothetical protein
MPILCIMGPSFFGCQIIFKRLSKRTDMPSLKHLLYTKKVTTLDAYPHSMHHITTNITMNKGWTWPLPWELCMTMHMSSMFDHVWLFINKPQKGDIFGAPTVMHTTTTSNVLSMLIETTHNSQGSNLWTFGSDPPPQTVA